MISAFLEKYTSLLGRQPSMIFLRFQEEIAKVNPREEIYNFSV